MRAGANPDAINAEGLTPLALALLNADIPALNLLLDAGADPNVEIRGVPLLSVAIVAGQAEIAGLLLDRGATPITGQGQATTAALAAVMGLDAIAERLGGVEDPTAGRGLVQLVVEGTALEVRAALEQGASPN